MKKRPVKEGGSLLKSPFKTASELNVGALTPTPPAPTVAALKAPRVGKAAVQACLWLVR